LAPEFLSPDVFVEEVQGKSGQITVASTSTFAMVGYSPRGPEGKAFAHGSVKEFFDRFGSYNSKSMVAYQASAFYANGGSQLVFVRELHSDATYASGAFSGKWDAKASGRGVWANGAEITISGNESFYNQATAAYSRFNVTVELVDPSTGLLGVTETFEAVDLIDDESPDYILKVLEANSEDISLLATSGGVPTELIPVETLGTAGGTGDGSTTAFAVSLGASTPLAPTTVKVRVNGVLVAQDDGEGVLVDVAGGPVVTGTVNYASGALSVVLSIAPSIGDLVTADSIKKPDASVTITLAGGSDGTAVISSDLVGAGLAANSRGIYALDAMDIQMSLAIPDFIGDQSTDTAILAYASSRADIVALLQPAKGTSAANAVKYKRNVLASTSSYGAMYWPWVKMPDPLNKNRAKVVPAVGHIAGRYAFTDSRENVGKAPAGVTRGQLSLILGLEREVTKQDRNTVFPAQINAIRSDAEVGTAIWGNRTLQVVGDFTDVNVRRLFIFLEKAQKAGLVDIVFENIGPVTFGLIKARLDSFLENLFLQGVIGSGVPDKNQAYKVICDLSNNPPSVQQSKRIVIDEFVKPNLAAEFIHLKVQKVFDASQI